MHNLKKVVAVIAVLAMVLGTMVTGFAATVTPAKVGSDVAGTDYETAAAELAALGIMQGYPDGTFKPGNQITRAEYATLVVRALGLESAAKLTTTKPAFSDVNADYQWAWGYITVATENGIIKGYPDGTFGPAKPVTYAEAVAMLVRALGYEPAVTGTWPVGYLSKGSELGITDDVKVSADGYANRGDVAVMVDNALDVDMMEQTGYGTDITYEVKEGKTLLSDKLNINEYKDYVVTATPKVDSGLDDNEIKMVDEDGKNEDTYTLAAGIDPDQLLGLKLTAWEKDSNDEIVYVKYDESQLKMDAVDHATEDSVYLYVADDDYDFAKDAEVYINNDKADPEDLTAGMYGRFVFEDGEVKYADVYDMTQNNMVVKSVNKDDETIDYIDSDGSDSTLDLTNADEGYKIFLNGKTIALSDLQADDVVSYADISGDWYYLFVTRDAKEGKLTKVKNSTFYIDGTEYDTSAGNLNDVTVYTMNDGKDYDYYDGTDATKFDDAIGEDVKILLDNVGEVAFLTTDVKVTSDDIFGVLQAVDEFSDEVKIYANGDKKTYDFDGDVYYGAADTGDLSDLVKSDVDYQDVPVMFRTDKDGVVTELYMLDVPAAAEDAGVTKAPATLKSFDDEKDTIVADSNVYYVEDDTAIIDTLSDPDSVAWDDIKSSDAPNAKAVIFADDKDRIKFMYFDNDDEYAKVAETDKAGIVVDYYYDGDWKIDVDEYDTGKVTYKVDKNPDLKKGVMISYDVNNDKAEHVSIRVSRPINANAADATTDIKGIVESRDGAYLQVGNKTYKFDSTSVIYEVKLDDENAYDTITASSYTKIIKNYIVYAMVDEDTNIIQTLFYIKPVSGTTPVPTTEGLVTYMNSTGSKIEVDGVIYTLDGDTILFDKDGKVLAIGNADIKGKITVNKTKVTAIKVTDGVVTSLKLAADDVTPPPTDETVVTADVK